MRDWQNAAPRWIARIHGEMPDCTPDELRRALRRAAGDFHCGTSWGRKVWATHCRQYLARLSGATPGNPKPIDWPADIHFPFRNGS